MMLLTAKTEKEFEVVAFSEGLKELNVNREDTLETVIAECSRHDFSSSRASMLDAPITGCLIEPLTSTARQNFLPVGATKLKAA
jgi:hypothetical protein